MSSSPNITLDTQELKLSFLVFDCTGSYNSGNTGGYGGPNYKSSSIILSELFIKLPGENDYRDPIDVTGDLPNANNTGYEITPSMIGSTDNTIPSGKYGFKLVHTFNIDSIEKKVTGYHVDVFIKDIKCCVDKLEVDPGKDAFRDEKQKKILELTNLLFSADKAICRGLYDKANGIIDYLKSQCKCNGCQ